MGLLSAEVEVILCNNIKHYESLGYSIPRYYDKKHKKYSVAKETKILVKISDLPFGSHAIVDVECDECGKKYNMEYKTYLKLSHKDGCIYCNKCTRKLFNSGENNSAWNPNITNEERISKRNYPEYIDFVKKVLQRDSYTCQCCGGHTNSLEVHHLDGYSWCKEKRLDVTNAITLCNDCHSNFHFVYGRRNNTKEQFEEWFGRVIQLTEFKDTHIALQKARKVYCVEDDKVYDSVRTLHRESKLNIVNIYLCCSNRIGGTVYGKHYVWADEVYGLSQQEVFDLVNKQKIQHLLNIEYSHNDNNKNKNVVRPVICLNTNQVFASASEAAKHYGLATNCGILRCCNNKQKTTGSSLDDMRLMWMFYSDYLKLREE